MSNTDAHHDTSQGGEDTPDARADGAAVHNSDGDYDYASLRLGFWWDGTQPIGVVFVHELGSTPEGVGRIAEATLASGFWSAAPVLPEHDGVLNGARIASTRLDDLVACVHEWREAMHQNAGAVVLVGCGLGGSLVLRAAADVDVAGIVTIGAPFRTFTARKSRVRLARLFVGDVAGIPGDVKRPGGYEPLVERMPAEAYERFVEVEAAGREALPDVSAPALVMQPREDHVVGSRDASRLFAALGSAEKELAWLEHSFHRAWIDHDRDLAADRVATFAGALLSRVRSGVAPAAKPSDARGDIGWSGIDDADANPPAIS